MERIERLEDMFNRLQKAPGRHLVVAFAHDAHTIEAVFRAVQHGLVKATLTGDEKTIRGICKNHKIDPDSFEISKASDEQQATSLAIELIRKGEGDMLMKGTVSTDKYMHAILHKEHGILPPGALLTHISVLDPVSYKKILIVGDVAIIPQPGLKEKQHIVRSLIRTAYALGIQQPKVAVLAATEQVLPGMEACVDAAVLSKMSERGQIKGAVIDGPMALDVALDKESADIKKVQSPVAGDADCLLFPNIEAGNVFYKCHTKLMGGNIAAIVSGAMVPAILSSRGDSIDTKLYSIALGAMMTLNQGNA